MVEGVVVEGVVVEGVVVELIIVRMNWQRGLYFLRKKTKVTVN